MHIRVTQGPHGVETKAVSDLLADADAQPALQPGQRTVWYISGWYCWDEKMTRLLIG